MREQKDNLVYIQHIRDAIDKIHNYTVSSSFEKFSNNEWDQAAIMRYFEIIGEATTKLTLQFKNDYSKIEWRDISDFRNFLIHDYMDIDVKIVWDTMKNNIPPLKEQIDKLLQQSEDIE